uniref:Sodium/solute symporter n=1 Tax=Clastoptera arizonana TaxID=38151 RepID=A0A1B6CPJ3_9HEMI
MSQTIKFFLKMWPTNSTGNEVEGLTKVLLTFNWVEYTVFCSMLGFSMLIGIYYGCYKQQNTVSEYLLGGKKMSIFPLTMSLVASHVSGITLLGVPAETYVFGTQYYVVFFSSIAISFLAVYFYIPVLYNLQLNSVYEYLELRFNRSVRILASLTFASSLILHVPIVIYVPSLAFNQVTGVSLHVIAPIVSLVCIFYTTFGGLKAVVWTDTLQSFFTLATILFIICLGCIHVGGFFQVFKIAEEGHRLEIFNFDPNPFARNTFWTVAVGTTFSWLANIVLHPGAVQRFTAVPTEKKAFGVMIWGCVGTGIVKTLTVMIGLLIYAKYHNCDPIARKAIKKSGQILPFYVMDVGGHFPGLTGLFVSGVVSTALSTMSANLNTVAGTIYEDFVMYFKKERHSEMAASCIMKMIVLLVGIVCVFLVFVVEKLGAIIQFDYSSCSELYWSWNSSHC